MYQRDPATGRAIRNGLLNLDYPAIPAATRFQHHQRYDYETPREVLGWAWSVTFGRWGAHVTFEDGWTGLTWPEPKPID